MGLGEITTYSWRPVTVYRMIADTSLANLGRSTARSSQDDPFVAYLAVKDLRDCRSPGVTLRNVVFSLHFTLASFGAFEGAGI